jgi:hypothetical protein
MEKNEPAETQVSVAPAAMKGVARPVAATANPPASMAAPKVMTRGRLSTPDCSGLAPQMLWK